MNSVLLADTAPQPWRNGSGITHELLAWPDAADWQVRISVATIAQDGPFSAWPGVQRWFTVVDGAGVALALPAGAVRLAAGNEPVQFPGEAAPGCRLLAGPTQDLNLMTRGGAGQMRRARPGSRAVAGTAWRGLYAADALTLHLDGAVMPVAAGTLLWSDSPQPVGWEVEDVGRAWLLHWTPA